MLPMIGDRQPLRELQFTSSTGVAIVVGFADGGGRTPEVMGELVVDDADRSIG